MAAGALGHRDLPALEFGQRLDRRGGRHQDRLRGGGGGLLGDVSDLGACGLREHRHGVGDISADIDAADVDRLEQRQAAGEFVPGHLDVERRQRLFQLAIGLEQGDQGGGFLIADAQRLCGFSARCGEGAEQGDGHHHHAAAGQPQGARSARRAGERGCHAKSPESRCLQSGRIIRRIGFPAQFCRSVGMERKVLHSGLSRENLSSCRGKSDEAAVRRLAAHQASKMCLPFVPL